MNFQRLFTSLLIYGLFARSLRYAEKIILQISIICLRLSFPPALITNENPHKSTDSFIQTKKTFILLPLVSFLFMAACSSHSKQLPVGQDLLPEKIKAERPAEDRSPVCLPPITRLRPQVAAEERLPYEDRLFSLLIKNADLESVLFGLAQQADLNLVIDKDVDTSTIVSVKFENLSIKDALENILAPCSYFYTLKGNFLRIHAMETRIFPFNYPLMSNKPNSDLGGDVLGNVGGETDTDLKGEFSIENEVENEEHLDIWEQIEKALVPKEKKQGGLLSEKGMAVINRMAGIIVVTDKKDNLLVVEKFLHKLESSLRRQVIIEAKIITVTLNNQHQYGIDWEFVQQRVFGDSEGEFSIGTNLGTGSELFNMGISFTRGSKKYSALLDALAIQGNINVLSAPRLNVLNNQSALMNVGQTIPYVDFELEQTTDNFGRVESTVVPTIQRAQAGITLGITPQIDENNTTILHIVPIISDLSGEYEFVFDDNSFTVPIINVRATDTVIRIADGETVVLGGLITEHTEDTVKRIPLLGDIPIFGKFFFSNQLRSNLRKEMVIILDAKVVGI